MGKVKSYVMDVQESAIECYQSGLTLEEAIEEVSKYFDYFVSETCTETYSNMNRAEWMTEEVGDFYV